MNKGQVGQKGKEGEEQFVKKLFFFQTYAFPHFAVEILFLEWDLPSRSNISTMAEFCPF